MNELFEKYSEKLIDGKSIADQINLKTKKIIESLDQTARIAIVLASDDPASHRYVELKMKKAEELGIQTKVYYFPKIYTKEQIISEIRKFRHNEAVNGVLIQLPFYPHLDEFELEIVDELMFEKDADGLTAIQQGRVAHLLPEAILPATVEAILEALNFCTEGNDDLTWKNITKNYRTIEFLKGKNILIINNSNLIGKPLGLILSTLNATVTIANIDTKFLSVLTRQADIIISATGKTNLINAGMVKDGVIAIDVTSEVKTLDNGSKVVLGDFVIDEDLMQKVKYITPVPGGIGPLTIACLLRNLVRS